MEPVANTRGIGLPSAARQLLPRAAGQHAVSRLVAGPRRDLVDAGVTAGGRG